MPYSDMFCCSSPSQAESKGKASLKMFSLTAGQRGAQCVARRGTGCLLLHSQGLPSTDLDHLGWQVGLASSWDVEQLPGGYMNIQVYSHVQVSPQQLVQAGIGVAADIAVPRAGLP